MLIVSGRGQVLAVDEPERHLAGECRRDEWAVKLVSACWPFSLRVCGFCISALMFLCSGGCISGGMGLRMAWVEAWMRGCMLIVSGRGQVLVLDEPERHLAERPLQSKGPVDPVQPT